MPKILNLENQIFDQLTVIKLDEEKSREKKRKWWICKCSCGKIVSISGDKLRSGHTTSCGCKKYKQAEDLTGQIFGDLKVVKQVFNSHKDGAVWECKCLICNNDKFIQVKAINLKLGKTTSCGCAIKSKGERKISQILEELKLNYKEQYIFEDLKGEKYPLRFDFAIFNNNKIKCLIEYQGIQHYESVKYFGGEKQLIQQQKYDTLKREYCKNKKIKLIEIPYLDYQLLDINYLNKLINNE